MRKRTQIKNDSTKDLDKTGAHAKYRESFYRHVRELAKKHCGLEDTDSELARFQELNVEAYEELERRCVRGYVENRQSENRKTYDGKKREAKEIIDRMFHRLEEDYCEWLPYGGEDESDDH